MLAGININYYLSLLYNFYNFNSSTEADRVLCFPLHQRRSNITRVWYGNWNTFPCLFCRRRFRLRVYGPDSIAIVEKEIQKE